MMPPWRYRCPEGHASITLNRKTDTYRCDPCGVTYIGDPIDAREVDAFPVDGEHDTLEEYGYDEVLKTVVELSEKPTRTWVRTRDIAPDRVKQAAAVLAVLEHDGLVQQRETSECVQGCWQPTDKGVATVRRRARREVIDQRASRAQLTPIGTAALIGFGAVLFVLTLAIANGVVVG